jgi:formate transporter
MPDSDNTLAIALDAYAPGEIAKRVETAGVAKARLSALQTLTLAALAGAFIAFGGMFYTLAMTGADPALGSARLLGGVAFSLGLILVVIAGAELFTGNNLIVMAWADRLITTRALLRNWGLVYLGNAIGAATMLALTFGAGLQDLGGGAYGETATAIAQAKVAISAPRAFFSGVLCNILVCLAVWMCFSSRRVTGKVFCVLFPVAAFVALGFEHSIANMYLIPAGMLAGNGFDAAALLANIIPVTLGNILGGGLLVAFVYWVIYRRKEK